MLHRVIKQTDSWVLSWDNSQQLILYKKTTVLCENYYRKKKKGYSDQWNLVVCLFVCSFSLSFQVLYMKLMEECYFLKLNF